MVAPTPPEKDESMPPPMFPLSRMLQAFVRRGSLTVIDAERRTHVFAGGPDPAVTMRPSDPSLHRKPFFNPELHAGEACMDERPTFPGPGLRDFLTLFSSTGRRWVPTSCRGPCGA